MAGRWSGYSLRFHPAGQLAKLEHFPTNNKKFPRRLYWVQDYILEFLLFNLAVTFYIGEWALGTCGVGLTLIGTNVVA